ncbi:MAG: type II secretion system F family protein [Phycisphaerales bacterium JB037]
MKYAYTAFDNAGRQVAETIEAASEAEARELIRAKGLFISSLAASSGKGQPSPGAKKKTGGGSVGLKHLAVFSRQLAVLVASGTPVVDAIAALEKQTKDENWRAIIADVRARVEQGEPLSEAMAAHPKAFDSVSRSLVAAGEASGQLEKMLDRLAGFIRQQQHVRKAVTGAMVYPTLLISVSVGVLTLMILFVLPRFAGMFESLDAELPATTRALMALSDWLRTWWWAVLIVLGAGLAGTWVWVRTRAGRRVVDQTLVSAPVLGPMMKSFATARLMRLLGVLVESRLPLLEALELTAGSSTNSCYRDLLDRAIEHVSQGESLSRVLSSSPLVEGSICEAIRNAERSGTIGQVMANVAQFMDEDNEVVVKSLTSIVEPVILLVLGGVVAFVAISMFLPMFDLVASASGGA